MRQPTIKTPSNKAGYQRGLSLVELMISITIGLLILVSLTALFVSQSKARSELDKSNRMIDNGRYALKMLADDVQLAGYWGEFVPPVPNACSSFSAHVGGVDAEAGNGTNTTPTPPAGITISPLNPGSDILTIRRTSTEPPIDPAAAIDGVNYLQVSLCKEDALTSIISTTPASFTLRQNNCTPTSATPYAVVRRILQHVYFISPNNVESPADGIPTLKRLEPNKTTGVNEIVPLVEGIEYIQIEYGVDSNSSFQLTATTTAGSLTLTALSKDPIAAKLQPGMGVFSDPKILAGYTIDGIFPPASITLIQQPGAPAIVTGTSVPLTIPYLNATAVINTPNLSILNGVNPELALARAGHEICASVLDAGPDFGMSALTAGTTITNLDATSITLSTNAVKGGTLLLTIPDIMLSPKPMLGDGVADTYVASPTSSQWVNVVSAKITLLARNIEPTAGYTDKKIYTLGKNAAGVVQTVGPFKDQYKRHVYTQLVRMINASGRREAP